MIFDTHAHYDDPAFDEDCEDVFTRFPVAGIGAVMDVASTEESCTKVLELAHAHEFIWAALGIHPSECGQMNNDKLQRLETMLRDPKVRAVGEIGLDYHFEDDVDHQTQQHWFREQLCMARRAGLPVIIHSRDAAKDTFDILQEEFTGSDAPEKESGQDEHPDTAVRDKNICNAIVENEVDFPATKNGVSAADVENGINAAVGNAINVTGVENGIYAAAVENGVNDVDVISKNLGSRCAVQPYGVIHCYSYSVEMARKFLKMGFYIGVGGVVTFKNAKKLKEVVKDTPLSRIVIETDCPYMAPVPHRGERNSSLLLPYVVKVVAELKGVSVQEVIDSTWHNACNLYRI